MARLKALRTTQTFPEEANRRLIVAETETSPSKNLTVLHVAVVFEGVANNDLDHVAVNLSGARHECLLSSSDENTCAPERCLHHKLDSLSGEGLERIVEAGTSGVLASVDGSGEGQ